MREMDFSEKNLHNQWLGVNSIWQSIQGEMKRFVKVRLERAMVVEVNAQVGCDEDALPTVHEYRQSVFGGAILSSVG